jgi:hypothetical protein
MILRYAYLSRLPRVFVTMTGLRPAEFEELMRAVLPAYAAAAHARLSRPGRQRAIGAGHPFALSARDQLLLTVVWLRQYPTQEALGYFFGVSDTAARSAIGRMLPLLEAAGRDTMRLPDPGLKHRRHADAVLHDIPELAVVVDSFEQRCQRPSERKEADAYYSGKKKMHTLKSQVAVRPDDGRFVDVGPSVPGPTADLTLLGESGLCDRLSPDCGLGGDLGYVGIATLHERGATPRRKPRGKDRPPEDVAYNQAFARERVIVEHSIRRLRRFEALSQTDRHRRVGHGARVGAVAGLVNRHIAHQQRRRAA